MQFEEDRVICALRRYFLRYGPPVAWSAQAVGDLQSGTMSPALLDAIQAYLRERPEWIYDDAAVLRIFVRTLAMHQRLPPLSPEAEKPPRTGARVVTFRGERYRAP